MLLLLTMSVVTAQDKMSTIPEKILKNYYFALCHGNTNTSLPRSTFFRHEKNHPFPVHRAWQFSPCSRYKNRPLFAPQGSLLRREREENEKTQRGCACRKTKEGEKRNVSQGARLRRSGETRGMSVSGFYDTRRNSMSPGCSYTSISNH